MLELSDSVTKTVLLAFKSEAELAVGKYENGYDEQENEIVLSLILIKCNDTEYSCSEGSCIPILEKCNFVPNCLDVKGKETCPILTFRNVEGYKSDLPGIQIHDNGTIKEMPLIINME